MQRATQVRSWIERHADEMAELLTALVSVNTENPPGRGLAECASVLNEALEHLEMTPETIELTSSGNLEEPRIVRATVGAGAKLLYFHGHFDVVPAQRREQFDPQRHDGKITGRGTADMKGGLVSMIYGAAAAREFDLLDDARIVLHFVCDEETGSTVGSGHLRAAELIDPGAVAMLTPEPTSGVVWHASRGAITLRVNVSGREAHVGQAHLGINAFEHLVEIARPLNALAHDLLETRTEFAMSDDDARGSMLVVGGAAGAGANFNVVPGAAWFSVDRRLNPEEDLDEEMARLTEMIDKAASATGAAVSIHVLQRQPSGRTDETGPEAVTLAKCVAAVEGTDARFEVCPGSLDTRWYAQLGIPAFGYGAGRLDVSHGPHEFIEEAAMGRCATVYALFAGAIAR